MINQTISHYRITGKLGSGGMGVVYEAEDLALGRKVALKFLPPQLSRDQNALDRFLLEARTASALNHPNICTIYAVENAPGENGQNQSFIAMELLEGQNLAEKLHAGPLPLDRLLDVAIQLADALDAAHAKGIIHRDIKPANIFVTQRSQIKVLDFGLAKLARREMEMETIGATQDSPAPAAANLTSPGATVGTISYMSPEQARGEDLDTRTDLFSLGSVIYQMATGSLPFAGATSAVVFHAILQLDPVPVQQLNGTLPPKLEEIIEKLLEKDRDLRYQSAADLRGDLRRLKRDVESGRRAATLASGSTATAAVASGPASAASVPAVAVSDSFRPTGSRGGSLLGRISRAVVAVALLLAAGYGIYSLLTRHPMRPFRSFSVTKLTEEGKAAQVAISPDGKYILSLMKEKNGTTSLWLRNVPTNSNTQVQPPADVYYNGLRFSPDGNYLYFVRSDPGNADLRFLYRAPLLGGTPERLAEDVDSNVTFSPDGTRVAFMRYDNPEQGKYQLIVRALDNGQESILASGPKSQALYTPAWSPDGKTILCGVNQPAGGLSGLMAVNTQSGQQHLVLSSDSAVASPTWLPDGSGLLLLEANRASNFTQKQIMFLVYPEGKRDPVTRDTNNYSDLSLAANGQVLATVLSEGRWNLYVASAASGGTDARPVAPVGAFTNFTWTHDGRLIHDKDNKLSWVNPDSGAKGAFATEQDLINGDPWECSDAHTLIFLGGKDSSSIWRTNVSGGGLKQLTQGKLDNNPVCAPDSKSAYYLDGGTGLVMQVPIDGGTARKVSGRPISSGFFDVSPDGRTVVFATIDHAAGHQEKLTLVATDTGEAKQIEFQRSKTGMIRFSRDGKALVYPVRENDVDNLWQQPLDGSAGKQLTSFKSEHIWDYHWSPDGSKLAVVRGQTDSDVVLMRSQQE